MHRPGQRRPRRFAPAIALAAMLGAIAGAQQAAAEAHWFGSNAGGYNTPTHPCDTTTSSQCVANNGSHIIYMGSALNVMRAATEDAIALFTLVDSLVVFDTTDTTAMDVSFIEGNYGDTSYWAYGKCSLTASYGGADPDRWCRPQIVVYNMTHPSNWDTRDGASGRNAVACHEMGHTLGLRHTDSNTGTCMRSAQTVSESINTDQKNHLNEQY